MSKKAKPIVSRGFKAFRNEIKDNTKVLRAIRECSNCKHSYDDENTKEEYCHNSNVSEYDMVSDGERECCSYWQPIWVKEKDNF